MTGPERAILYWLALETGIRSSELRSLTRASFDLDSDVPTVTVEAAYSKRRRRDVQPLRFELAGLIRSFIANRTPTTRIFKMPRKENVAVMYRSDLTNARESWIDAGTDPQSQANRKASDFLRYVDSQGRYADFHALRHSFITHLGRTGIHFKTAQDLARHSVPTLTARYTHGFKGDEVAAINALPDLSPRLLRAEEATGTDGAPAYSEPGRNSLAPCLPKKGRFPDNEVDSGILNNDKKAASSKTAKAKKNKDFPDKNSIKSTRRWGARAVEWTGLENRRGLRVTVGSNPTPTVSMSLQPFRCGGQGQAYPEAV